MTENQEYIYQSIISEVKMGFLSADDMTDIFVENVGDEGWENEMDEAWIKQKVKEAYTQHLAASKSWVHPTDTDKLGEAFDYLCKQKIIALHNAGYTQEDAISDVNEIYSELVEDGKKPIGYCFYHAQDLERVIETDNEDLLLGFYGVKSKDTENALLVGNKIVEALTNKGFQIEWDKTPDTRIAIKNFNWKKVFVNDDEAEKWEHERIFDLMP